MMIETPTNFSFVEIFEGQRVSHAYEITAGVYEHFLSAFQDASPIHVNPEYAKQRGYPGIVMHGSILNGFVSHFVGMRFPGRRSLLLSVDIRFRQPCYLEERLELQAEVTQKVEAQRVVVLNVTFFSQTQSKKVGNAVVTVRVADA